MVFASSPFVAEATMDKAAAAPRGGADPHETTAVLIARARAGDGPAGERLFARCLPVLRRWAHHRLPRRLRDTGDTDDLVQETLLRAFRNLDTFEHRGEGAFLAYLRMILLNAVRDGMRLAEHRHRALPVDETIPDVSPSAVEEAIGAEQLQRFEDALSQLPEIQQQAVMLRIEFGYTHAQIAEALERSSPDAARMIVTRSLARLAEILHDT
jgi:RNA polymerase sigma-70 factor (ECF subfamily)